jgi:glyoxylase-like metal-dependent hydrolase (beta-lactamase superfamily II)
MRVRTIPGIGYESNVYLVEDEKNALIDTGTGMRADSLCETLSQCIDLADIAVIILTHEHFDHCGGAATLKRATGARIMMHFRGAPVLEEGQSWSAAFFNAQQRAVGVDRKLRSGDDIVLGSATLHVVYTPGHSPGSICLYERGRRVLFSGDTVFAGGDVGRTDFFGGDSRALKESVAELAKLEVETLYPGHGPTVPQDAHVHIARAERSTRML